jgi:type I restriction enzyme S subunit
VGISAEGARNHGLLNIAPSDFFNTRIVLPQYEEQRAIGNFLSNLDHLITTQQRKLETLKRLKQFMLQNLFV